MLYIAGVEIHKTYYMETTDHVSHTTHLVEAETEDEATQKVQAKYVAMTSDYGVYYSVSIKYINELIK